jgi:asparagine synthase (glutamine-hydrolysing)
MCGICGYITKGNNELSFIEKMVATLRHRGPDDSGFIFETTDSGNNVALGHARLSIIDLSYSGHQPMHYKHFSIVFNGEIYNFKEIREELQNLGHIFISDSDTEVVLHAFELWHTQCVTKFIGMFAFVIYDKEEDKLFCCRDRAGVKPFFYYFKDNTFIFASEMKAMHQHPGFVRSIDNEAVNLYFRYGYVPSPKAIFQNTSKLQPGNWMTYNIKENSISFENYWNVRRLYEKPPISISFSEAKKELTKILESAFQYRMVSDVPVGVFLSGGYDSTLVTALLQKNSQQKIRTFTIGFNEGNNEAPFAKEIARFLGTEHTEFYCTEKEALEIIPDLPLYFDEPFGDSSAIPTTLVSKMARKNVTVALSADAGDEVFIGYYRYRSLYRHLENIKKIPGFSRRLIAYSLIKSSQLLPDNCHLLHQKMSVLGDILKKDEFKCATSLLDGIESMPVHLLNRLLLDYNETANCSDFIPDLHSISSPFAAALSYDYDMYLQNDILTKVDRATMSVSLEGREPLLDHRIVEFAAQLPMSYKYDGFETKKIIKSILYDYVPKELMLRPKTGFSIPVNKWLRKDLKGLMIDTLNLNDIASQGIINTKYLSELLNLYINERLFDDDLIWRILQFQMWYKKWMA